MGMILITSKHRSLLHPVACEKSASDLLNQTSLGQSRRFKYKSVLEKTSTFLGEGGISLSHASVKKSHIFKRASGPNLGAIIGCSYSYVKVLWLADFL